jgi:CHAT domain-containing protein
MHTIIDDKNPMYTKLAFSQNKEDIENSFLNTYEIYNMDINARMTVLSACNTGNGKLQKGEGIMSLARAFLFAGCPSIVMTLWAVEDNASGDLISSFYKYLSKGKSKDESLRLAKLDYIKNSDKTRVHPYFWSGYVNIGDTRSLYENNKIDKPLFFLLSIAGIFMIVFFVIKRRSKYNTRN